MSHPKRYLLLINMLFFFSAGIVHAEEIFDTSGVCDSTIDGVLRYGLGYLFNLRLDTGEYPVGVSQYAFNFSSKSNYSDDKIPNMLPKSSKFNRNGVTEATSTFIFLEAESKYGINYHPKDTSAYGDISLRYKTEMYRKIDGKWVGPTTILSCKNYKISWCGDGILDAEEQCDPNDKNKNGWNGKQCTADCLHLESN